MTLPEFGAFLSGFAAFHGADEDDGPSGDDFMRALAEEELGRAD